MENTVLDAAWILVCAGLVFAMQAGFLCLESGLTRSKNAINVAVKNMTDFSVSLLLFWACGFALMFGASQAGWIGTSYFFVPIGEQNSGLATMFLFQAMFCATAATIVSGAVAGRMRFSAYIITTVIVSGVVYPVFGHWAWGGAFQGPPGWLAASGFVDFAGSTVVHSVGAWSALAATLVIGPRIGRFQQGHAPKKIPGSNVPMAMLGTLLLWMGWIGFNGGSTLEMNSHVAGIIGKTLLAGAAGMLTALVVGWLVLGHAESSLAINGSLAGLVAITAGCHAVTAPSAVVIGAIGAVMMMVAHWILERHQVDDAIGVVPVHGAAGVWGTIAVAAFGIPELLGTGLSRSAQIQTQLIGVCVAFGVAFGTTFPLLRLIHSFLPLRVTPEQEEVGLNVTEHGASTELYDVLVEMELQRHSGDFSRKVTVETGTDVGIIAAQYNRVLDKISKAEVDREELNRQLIDASHAAGMAEVATGVLHNVGNVLNSVNVSANLLMERSQISHVGDLTKASNVISEHQNDLATFISEDERGKHFPRLLKELASNLSAERDMQVEELRSLAVNIEHIKEIVNVQQTFAHVRGTTESVTPVELVEDALKINNAGLIRHSVDVVREFGETPPIVTEKHKVLQILVNLISNAKYALNDCDRDDKTMILIVASDEENVRIEVRDNGVGVSQENLTNIFSHGFTTRKEGHGFGLHSSALAAQELGGSLSVRSDGPGQGATFTLELPAKINEEVLC